jgi:hypothetical protein
MTRAYWLIAPLLLLAGCIPAAPRPAAPVAPPPAPPPPVVAAPTPAADWRDAPLTPGSWSYRRDNAATAAVFGNAGVAAFILQCNRAARTITLSRAGTASGSMTVRTSNAVKSWPATPAADGRIAVTLAAADPALDQIAFSRGRFTIADAGLPTLVLPSWAEPARVIEDCRG